MLIPRSLASSVMRHVSFLSITLPKYDDRMGLHEPVGASSSYRRCSPMGGVSVIDIFDVRDQEFTSVTGSMRTVSDTYLHLEVIDDPTLNL